MKNIPMHNSVIYTPGDPPHKIKANARKKKPKTVIEVSILSS
jgi:hypothetical protein